MLKLDVVEELNNILFYEIKPELNKESILQLLKNRNLFFMVYNSNIELRIIPQRFFTSMFMTGSFNLKF